MSRCLLAVLLCLVAALAHLGNPQFAKAQNSTSSASELRGLISPELANDLRGAGSQFRQGIRSRKTVAFSLPARRGKLQIELTPTDIRAPHYRAERRTATGVEPDRTNVYLFKAASREESGNYYTRFALIDSEDGSSEIRGYVVENGIHYRVVQNSSNPQELIVSSLTEEEARLLTANCGTDHVSDHHHHGPSVSTRAPSTRMALKEIELATEADFEYFQAEGGSGNANAKILSILNAVDAIYRDQLNLTIKVVYQHVWTTSSDPYTTSASGTLLEQFRNHWQANFSSSVSYDLAHLWTGRDLDNGVAGVAYLFAACSNSRYGLSQRLNFTPHDVPLVAHEIGHNVAAEHDVPCSSTTWVMCPILQTNANVFSTTARNAVAAFVSSASCLGNAFTPPTVTLSIGSASISESSATTFVRATLSEATTVPVTVALAFSGTATRNADYTVTSDSITIAAGATTGSVAIQAINDSLDEDNETVVADISAVTNGVEATPQQVTTNIIDNDPLPTVSLAIGHSAIAEASGSTQVTASLSTPSGRSVTVALAFTGSASGTDYTASASSISIPAGASSASITITARQDSLDEENETIVITASSATNATLGSSSQVSTAITDDDPPPTVTLSSSTTVISENSGTATISATLNTRSSRVVTVTLAYSGVAIFNTDYSSGTTITIPAGQLVGSISLSAMQDTGDESDEAIIIDISSVDNGVEQGQQQRSVTLVDDDPLPRATLTVSPTSISENNAVATARVQLDRTSDKSVVVQFVFAGTASPTVDYQISASSVTIFPGSLSGQITLTSINDARDELDETVIVSIQSLSNAVEQTEQQSTLTLVDDDPTPSISLSASNLNIPELGGSSTVVATLSAASNLPVSVALSRSGSAATSDYSLSSSTITIAPGDLSASVSLTSVDDLVDENDESVVVQMHSPVNVLLGAPQQVSIVILDDDTGTSITIDSLKTTNPTPRLRGTVGQASASVAIILRGQTFNATNNGDGTWELVDNSITPPLADGVYDVVARATTSLGIISFDSSVNELEIDTTGPQLIVHQLATSDRTPALTGSIDEPGVPIQLQVDSRIYAPVNNGDGSWQLADNSINPPLADGVYEVVVTAMDALGNPGVDSTVNELTIDTIAPTVTINQLTTSTTSPQLTGLVSEPLALITVIVQGRNYSATNLGNGTWRLNAGTITPALTLGVYDIVVEATDPAGNAASDTTVNELTIEEPDTDSDGLKDSVDNCPLHPNPDQADDDEDGIGNSCDASYALPGSPAYVKWNTFLKQWNFLELIAQGTQALSVRLTVFNLAGRAMAERVVLLSPNSEQDVDINAIIRQACTTDNPLSCQNFPDLDGDGLIDSYGLVKVEFDDTNPAVTLIGRLTNYRPDPAHRAAPGGSFSFALTRELRPLTRGTSYAVANTFDPQNLGFLVPNWSELIFIGDETGSDSMGFTIRLYDQAGTLVRSQYLLLGGLQERDTPAGHDILNPQGGVVEAVYLVEVIPDNPQKPYLFSVTRYSSNAPAGFEPETYNYSVSAPSRQGSQGDLFVPISREAFSCGSALTWVEVANTSTSPVVATVRFRNGSGALVGSTVDTIPAKAQFHYNASALLGVGEIGSVEIESNVPGRIIAQAMTYILECDRAGIQTAYTSIAREVGRRGQIGTGNSFIQMSNTLRVLSTSATQVQLALDLLTYLNESSAGSMTLPSWSSRDEMITQNPQYVFPGDRYGTIAIRGNNSQEFLAEVLRRRFKVFDGQVRLDFVIPTQVN